MKKLTPVLFLLAFALAVPSATWAKVAKKTSHKSYSKSFTSGNFGASRQGKIQAGLGLGVAFHDPSFDLRLGSEYFVTNNISAGLDLDIVAHASTLFGFDVVGRYHFDIPDLPRFVPYAGMGLGAIVNTNGNGGFDVLVTTLGARYEVIAERLFVGPDIGIHVLT
ncbi:MAG: hypothetical protein HY073_02250, partial [Deltaproteobacteria bacterium]|nr:hypothetical protein [Deltaproteobacteria bacterium]